MLDIAADDIPLTFQRGEAVGVIGQSLGVGSFSI